MYDKLVIYGCAIILCFETGDRNIYGSIDQSVKTEIDNLFCKKRNIKSSWGRWGFVRHFRCFIASSSWSFSQRRQNAVVMIMSQPKAVSGLSVDAFLFFFDPIWVSLLSIGLASFIDALFVLLDLTFAEGYLCFLSLASTSSFIDVWLEFPSSDWPAISSSDWFTAVFRLSFLVFSAAFDSRHLAHHLLESVCAFFEVLARSR